MITLSNPRFVKIIQGKQGFTDRRFRVDAHVFRYTGSDGEEYLKSFECKPGETPTVPPTGTHLTINQMKIQWKKQNA
jgi:hypothetical protein